MAHNEPPEYERYWQLARWFFKSPENVERVIRLYGTIEDFEEQHNIWLVIMQREKNRKWLRATIWDFFKVFGAIGAGIVAIGGAAAILRSLLGW